MKCSLAVCETSSWVKWHFVSNRVLLLYYFLWH